MTNSEIYKHGFGSRTKEEDDKIRQKCKGSSSPKRVFAQQLRRLKENPEKTDSDIFELINNPTASASQIQEMIKMASGMDLKPNEFIQLINTAIKKHSAIFGNRINMNANIDSGAKVKELELQLDCVKRAVYMLIREAELARFYEWNKKYSKEQCDDMIAHIKVFFDKEVIEQKAKKNYEFHRVVRGSLEDKEGLKNWIKDNPDKIKEIQNVDFTLPELSEDERFDSAKNLRKIKERIDKEKEKKKVIVVAENKQEEIVDD
jgi:hypothetical protein